MKKKKKLGAQIREEQASALDLLDMLTYMTSIASADISRDKIFELTSQKDGFAAKHVRKIYQLVKNYGYEYTRATKIVAEEARNPMLRAFLMRFASALATGEKETTFLNGEVDRIVDVYTNKYENDVEMLKKWSDAYTAILVSVVMVIAVFLISSMLFQMGDLYLTAMCSGTLLCFIGFFGVYIIYRASPYEKITHSLNVKSKEQELAEKMSIIILPASCSISFILLILGVEPWIILFVIGALFAPIGIVGMIDGKKIERADEDISPFLKSLGSTAGATGATLTKALERMDRRSVASLEENVNRLYKRLKSGLNSKICWYDFVGETGSELINKSTNVFLDAINLGGDPTKVGETVAKSTLGITLLRAKRKLVSGSFLCLVIPLHATMTGVLLFIYQIMFSFNSAVAGMMVDYSDKDMGVVGGMAGGMGFNVGGNVDVVFMANFVTFVIFVLTVSDACASKYAAGGSNYTLCFYLSILFIVSAVVVLVVPIMADSMFSFQ